MCVLSHANACRAEWSALPGSLAPQLCVGSVLPELELRTCQNALRLFIFFFAPRRRSFTSCQKQNYLHFQNWTLASKFTAEVCEGKGNKAHPAGTPSHQNIIN